MTKNYLFWKLGALVEDVVDNCKTINLSGLAFFVGLDKSELSRWCSCDRSLDRFHDVLKKLAMIQKKTGDKRIKEWIDNAFKEHGE